jgi:hypothetical protein
VEHETTGGDFVSDQDERPSDWLPPGAAQPRSPRQQLSFLGYGVVEWIVALSLGVVVLVGYKACAPTGAARSSAADRASSVSADTIGAWVYMQEFVKRRLSSPKSASFPFGGHRSVVALGEGRYRVTSYVDAKNAFGVEVRTHFIGVVRRTPAGWELESLVFDN